MDLRNWEFYDSGNALVGATVKVRDAILTHPNAGTVLATTTTDTDGAWAFTGLTDVPKDVEVIWGNVSQYHKWYKGRTRHDVGVVWIEEYAEFVQTAGLPVAGAGNSTLGFRTSDGEPVYRSGAAGAQTAIATYAGATGVLKATGWGTIGSAEITDDSIVNADVNSAAAIALSKLAAGSSGVVKSNGSVISAGNQIVSADITDGTIATADLANNAVSLVSRASASTPSLVNTTALTVVTGTSITKTFNTTSQYLFLARFTRFNSTVAATLQVPITRASDNVAIINAIYDDVPANGNHTYAFLTLYAPGAVTETYRVSWACPTGASTLSALEIEFIIVELKK